MTITNLIPNGPDPAAMVVTCPNCHQAFPLTEAIIHQVQEHYAEEREREIRARLLQEVMQEIEPEVTDLREQVHEREQTLAQMRKQELAFRRERRELDQRRRDQDLALERARDDSARHARAEADRSYRPRLQALEQQVRQANKRAADLERQTQQERPQEVGQQAQILFGEELRRQFPEDDVTITPRGRTGADVLETVRTKAGRACGKALYECKNTLAWDGRWVPKLREDQRRAGADIGVIVSARLPEDLESIARQDVYIYDFSTVWYAVPALRRLIQGVALHRWAATARQDQGSQLFDYVMTGDFFLHMRDGLATLEEMAAAVAAEKSATPKRWAAEQKRIDRVAQSLARLMGDLDGLGLELPPGTVIELPPGADGTLPPSPSA